MATLGRSSIRSQSSSQQPEYGELHAVPVGQGLRETTDGRRAGRGETGVLAQRGRRPLGQAPYGLPVDAGQLQQRADVTEPVQRDGDRTVAADLLLVRLRRADPPGGLHVLPVARPDLQHVRGGGLRGDVLLAVGLLRHRVQIGDQVPAAAPRW
ncbi:hypothetical protein [Streptomyces bacillaris]|uniref:hypothetical protein n=1 Tax=Streptomyces bacillaris TaxID=68179 RepID=UPI00365F15A0